RSTELTSSAASDVYKRQSKMAVDGLGAAWSTSTIEQPEEAAKWFSAEIQNVNEAIYQEGIAHPEMPVSYTHLTLPTKL
ncbi:hypothetical protein KQJ29_35105, partial [Enterococcus sp. S181_ASV_20]|nr:hypothetical protein [Enterococcus sp. S181_ASV_20]